MKKQIAIFCQFRKVLPVAVFFTLFYCLPLKAGWVYQMEESDSVEGLNGRSMEIYLEGEKLLIKDASAKGNDMIFDATKETMWVLDHGNKTYMQIDKAMIQKLAKQFEQAMAQYEEALNQVPPAQREMMERMMKERMPQLSAKKTEISVKDTGKTKSVNGRKATLYEVLQDNAKTQELWVAPWSDVEGSEEVASAFENMTNFFSEMMKAFSNGPAAGLMQAGSSGDWLKAMSKLNGFPVLTKEFDKAGELVSETALKRIEKRDFDSGTFEIPSGYKATKIEM